jgi:hypothetical protein
MNLNFYDDINGIFSAERNANYRRANTESMPQPDYNGDMPPFPKSTPLAMAYVPFQSWGDTKSAEDALECGTLFSDLVYPFKGGGNR